MNFTKMACVSGLALALVGCTGGDSGSSAGGAGSAAGGGAQAGGGGTTSEVDGGGGRPPLEGPEGCYLSAQRMCDCDIAEEACTGEGQVWTEGCASCATADADGGVAPEPDAGPVVYGCYLHAEHRCDCAIAEEACTMEGQTWTTGCDACAAPGT